ncbi:MAG: prepilin-type N-terminal cleavage/methylation domain-containing protein, partial [Deltaproteobacteria bacterium]|nr:prepilin-type N-terminal cleavage/methylation domain-containing protein [Deltaproteobacteria bacterium]
MKRLEKNILEKPFKRGDRRSKGFTLVELLTAMSLATILIATTAYVFITSSSAFRAQEHVISIQEQLRFAVEQIKRDVRKAGFLATPDSAADDNVCPKPLQRLMAISFARGGAEYLPEVNLNIAPSSVTLFGAFASPNVFYTISITGNVVTIQQGAGYPQTLAEFNQIFNSRHLLRIVNKDQYEMYFGISAADFASGTITLDSVVPVVEEPNYCGIHGVGEGLEVNVANYIRYSLIADVRDGAPAGKIDLVREELQDDGVTPYEGSRLIIAEYIVDMQFYDFAIDNDPTRMDPNMQLSPLIENVVNLDG